MTLDYAFILSTLPAFLKAGGVTLQVGLIAIGTSLLVALIESGKSIGLSDWQLLRHVILPQAGILSLPALFANFIFLLKETTVVSAVAAPVIL